MKNKKSMLSIVSVTLIFTLLLALLYFAFALAERIFPSSVLKLKKELLYIGAEKDFKEYTPQEEGRILTLSELLLDERSSLDNSLLLISSSHPSEGLDFSSVCEYKESDVFFDRIAHDGYSSLSAFISEEFGEKLYVMSAYRSKEEQEEIYREQGEETAQRPGESEHESGLALDVYVSGFAGAGFFKTDVGKYINMHSHKYGFIIRYPDGKQDITGISFEPWHIRYVGFPHAEIISLNFITLEEYLLSIEYGKYYSFKNFIITKTDEKSNIHIPNNCKSISISPDNCGSYIITFELNEI